jgi:hypothetical protein
VDGQDGRKIKHDSKYKAATAAAMAGTIAAAMAAAMAKAMAEALAVATAAAVAMAAAAAMAAAKAGGLAAVDQTPLTSEVQEALEHSGPLPSRRRGDAVDRISLRSDGRLVEALAGSGSLFQQALHCEGLPRHRSGPPPGRQASTS